MITTDSRQRVGFIGLGEMGLPMATRLIGANFEVVGFDPRTDRADLLVGAGGRAASSARDAAQLADAVVLIPFDGPQLEDGLFGADGALGVLKVGSLVLAMATVGPPAMRAIARKVADVGAYEFVDAPVTGGAARALRGDLTAIAAGSAQAIDRAMPLLQAMCSKVFHVGPEPGAAQTTKLINQLVVGIHLAAAAEAFALGTAAGVDATQLYQVLSSGFARSEVLDNRVPAVLDGSLRTGGSISIYLKDLPLALEMARQLEVPLFTGSAAFNLVQLAAELGGSQGDDARVIALLMELVSSAHRQRGGIA